MPRQSELADVKITLNREYATAEYILPLFDRGFRTHRYIMDLGEGRLGVVELGMVRKMGDEISVQLPGADPAHVDTVNPSAFFNLAYLDIWGVVGRVKTFADAVRSLLAEANLANRRVSGQKVSDLHFSDDLGRVEHVELRSFGLMRKVHPVSDFAFDEKGALALRAPQKR